MGKISMRLNYIIKNYRRLRMQLTILRYLKINNILKPKPKRRYRFCHLLSQCVRKIWIRTDYANSQVKLEKFLEGEIDGVILNTWNIEIFFYTKRKLLYCDNFLVAEFKSNWRLFWRCRSSWGAVITYHEVNREGNRLHPIF